MTDDTLHDLLEHFRPFGAALCARLEADIRALGFPESEACPRPVFELASYAVVKDPYSGELGLAATWTNERGYRIGGIQFHGDGSFYAEFDVAAPHPTDRRWFVEGVTAWGRGDTIKSEPKLLAALD